MSSIHESLATTILTNSEGDIIQTKPHIYTTIYSWAVRPIIMGLGAPSWLDYHVPPLVMRRQRRRERHICRERLIKLLSPLTHGLCEVNSSTIHCKQINNCCSDCGIVALG